MAITNLKVDFFFSKAKKWQEDFKKLKTVILDSQRTENQKITHVSYCQSSYRKY